RLEHVERTLIHLAEHAVIAPELGVVGGSAAVEHADDGPRPATELDGLAQLEAVVARRNVAPDEKLAQPGLKGAARDDPHRGADGQRLERHAADLRVALGPPPLPRKRRDHDHPGAHERPAAAAALDARRVLDDPDLLKHHATV